MVKDNITGLIWEKKSDDNSFNSKNNKYTWQEAQTVFIEAMNSNAYGGFTDWRLPTMEELITIENLEYYERFYQPSIHMKYFSNTIGDKYWSSTTSSKDHSEAWCVRFTDHITATWDKTEKFSARAVRGGKRQLMERFIKNGDGTVSDIHTGLMWQINSEYIATWKEALTYCENLRFSDYTDWRLPNAAEMQLIVDFSKSDDPMFYNAFYDENYYRIGSFWTSSECGGGCAYFLRPSLGDITRMSKREVNLPKYGMVRAVRGGQNQKSEKLIIMWPMQATILITGTTTTIIWQTADIEDNVKITLSRQGGKIDTFETITPETENDGNYEWSITGTPSPNCMLKIEPISNPYSGTQQSFFTIKNPDIKVDTNVQSSFSFSGPESFTGSGTSWTKDNSLPGDYTISYSPLACWQTPAQESKNLTYWATLSFQGLYTPSPSLPVQNLQADLPIETMSDNNQISVEWEASDECTKGFSYAWDNQYNTDPPLTITTKANQVVSPKLTNRNDHWFHIRTIDIHDNASETIHLGPFNINDSMNWQTPVANFHAAPMSGDAPLEVAFTDQSNGKIDQWLWLFGDGTYSHMKNPVHTYHFSPVPYDVQLTVEGPGGRDTKTIIDYIRVTQMSALILLLPKTAIENMNSNSVKGKLIIPFTRRYETFINLSASSATISFPQTAIIPAGLTEISFSINAIDNDKSGSEKVTLTATASGYISTTSEIIIIDDDMHTQAPDTIYAFSDGNHRIKLFWPFQFGSELDPLNFEIYRSDSEDGYYYQVNSFSEFNVQIFENKPVYEFIDTDLQYDATYWYTIKTIRHEYFESDFSHPVSITPKPHPDTGNFRIEILDPVQYVEAGKLAKFDISILSEDHFNEDEIQLRATCNYLKHTYLKLNRESIPPDTSTQLIITVPNEMAKGDYIIDIDAISKCCSKKAQITLKVVVPIIGESTITVIPSPDAIGLNDTFSLKGKIIPSVASGKPYYIHIKAPGSDHWDKYPGTLLTKSSFIFNDYHPDQKGKYLIKASWDGISYLQGSESEETILRVGKGKSQLSFSTSNEDITPGSLFQFTVKLYPKLIDQPITIQVIKPDESSETIGGFHLTDDEGSVSLYYQLEDQTGIWKFTAYWPGNDTYVGAQSHPFPIYPGIETGLAIIVAGGGMNDDLWPFSECFSKKFYLYLKGKRFSHDQIMYFSDYTYNYDDNGDGIDDIIIDNNEPKANDVLEYIAGLTSSEVSEKKPLIIYMHAHGSADKFQVNTHSDFTAGQLDSVLDTLQESTNCSVALILDACKSGAFIEKLTPVDNQKRILISSAENTPAKNIVTSDHEFWAFSKFLLDALSIKSDLESGFIYAKHNMAGMKNEFSIQTPVIIKSNPNVLNTPFFIGGVSEKDAALPPEILSTTPNQVITPGNFKLFAHVYSLENIQSVKVTIMPPFLTEQINKYRPDAPIQNIESMQLYDMDHDNTYEGDYTFIYNGTYGITFFARDIDNNVDQKSILLTLEKGKPYSHLNEAISILKLLAGVSVETKDTIFHYFGCRFDLSDAIYWMGEVSN
jgi:PKD repeat protein